MCAKPSRWTPLCALTLAAISPLRSPPPVQAAVRIDDAKDRRIVERFLAHAARVPERISAEHCRKMAAGEPEGYTWKILPQADMLLTAYEVSGDAKHLDRFVATVANMQAAMTKGPDGFLGWYGKPLGLFRNPDKPDLKADVIISSFRMVEVLCRFLEIAARDDALARKFARRRAAYLDLMTGHLVKKWTARGNYVDLGPGGAIYRTHFDLRDVKGNLTEPHNKHSTIVRALLALHRVTGDDAYMRMAVKLGTRFKRCLTLKGGHYEWNYWDPAGAWDVHPSEKGRWKHWIGPEHRSGYYSLSLTQAVMLYHHGVVFRRADVDRFLKTQLEMTWNGDLERPEFFRVDRSRGKQSGQYICAALAPFDRKIHTFLYAGARQDERVQRAAHSWQGGPVANGYLVGKFLYCPAAKAGRAIHAEVGRRFLARPENRRLAESLELAVTGTGYRPPAGPAQMKPMPTAPRK